MPLGWRKYLPNIIIIITMHAYETEAFRRTKNDNFQTKKRIYWIEDFHHERLKRTPLLFW